MNQILSAEKSYTYPEVLKQCLTYFNNDELAATTWINKYCLKDKQGNYLEKSPDDMHLRMAREFCRIEKKYAASETVLNDLSAYGKTRRL